MTEIKDILASNLRALRKARGLTQLELAEQLNYSDKSVSKWEHGDAAPDIEVLAAIAAFYGVRVDDLITEHADGEPPAPAAEAGAPRVSRMKGNRRIITLLAALAVWLAVTVTYAMLYVLGGFNVWQVFMWAVPATAVVLIVFHAIWARRRFSPVLTSVLVWTTILCLYFQFLSYNLWLLALVGIPLQAGVVLWAKLKR
ncbi:MAG: helix-turn-helix domain-containing protein [Clostridiales bacterium]|nr:helix-turn-helix domain-containing protein [Clostridiales bacterium]